MNTKYLATPRNPITGKITLLVPTILDFLYDSHGRVTPQQLANKTTIVKLLTYDPAQPIDLILNSIDDLFKYALAVKAELRQS